ncbi:MAG: DUF192 domain-containing protein [Candidatus Aenigmarchaeota archaeon]|nr:DUF192 domain-containing protein [Candidatus Aenigmarchaeota archaeon]
MMAKIFRNSEKLFGSESAGGFAGKVFGLMFRNKLPDGSGMLFSFPLEYTWSFWMFGMRFPIDIIFMDRKKKIIHIERNARPLSFDPSTWKTIKPRKKFMYTLEINAGEAKDKRIKVGDVLTFTS